MFRKALSFSLLLSDTDGYKAHDINIKAIPRKVTRCLISFSCGAWHGSKYVLLSFLLPQAPPQFTLPTIRGFIHPSSVLDLGLLRRVTNDEAARRLPSRRAIIPRGRFAFKRARLRSVSNAPPKRPRRRKLLSFLIGRREKVGPAGSSREAPTARHQSTRRLTRAVLFWLQHQRERSRASRRP
jgi:hypothetical protein